METPWAELESKFENPLDTPWAELKSKFAAAVVNRHRAWQEVLPQLRGPAKAYIQGKTKVVQHNALSGPSNNEYLNTPCLPF